MVLNSKESFSVNFRTADAPGSCKQVAATVCLILGMLCLSQNAFSAVNNVDDNAPPTAPATSQSDPNTTTVAAPEAEQPELTDPHYHNEDRCHFRQEHDDWIDGVRHSTHDRLCQSARWFDGLFGDKHEFNDQDFRGKISVGFRQDENDGFDPRLRIKIRTRLPNVSTRFNAFVGRVEADSYISNTEVRKGQLNTVGLRSVDDDDAEWLVGIGYRNPNKRDNGFDFSVGAKLSSGLNPYAKVAHRYVFNPSIDNFWKSTQTLFWRRDEGYGVSSTIDYTRFIGEKDIFEWDIGAKYTDNSEQWEWITSTTWHHSFTDKKGISTRGYVRGEEENVVAIPEFGVTFTYVRPFLRPWLAIETGIDFRWEKEFEDGPYKSATRIGIQFEMLLGDYYGRRRALSE